MCAAILSYVFPILGVLFLILSFSGALIRIIQRYLDEINKTRTPDIDLKGITSLTEAFSKLIKAVGGAPLWLICFLIGILLILMGTPYASNAICKKPAETASVSFLKVR